MVSDRWTTTVRALVRATAGTSKVVLVRGEIRPPGSTRATPPADALVDDDGGVVLVRIADEGSGGAAGDDPDLPALAALVDADRARPLVQAALHAANPAYRDAQVSSCRPEVMRYQAGLRCTTRYELAYDRPTPAPSVVVSKTHLGGEGLVAWDAMRALWATSLADGQVVTIAEPLAYDPTAKVLFQGPVPGDTTLKAVLREALLTADPVLLQRVEQLVDATADGLVALHRSGAAAREQVTFDDHLHEARQTWTRLTSVVPALRGAAEDLFTLAGALAAGVPPDPLVASHRSFRPAQVLIDGDCIGFIDFDGFCHGEPALDLALMRASLRCYGASLALPGEADAAIELEARLDLLDALCDRFLRRYLQHAPATPQRVLAWELLDVFANLRNAWTKIMPNRPPTTLAVLRRLLGAGP